MSAIDLVRLILGADASVSSIIGTRIFPIELPQSPTLPALVLHLVDEVDGRHLTGSNCYPVARLIVDCIGTSYQAADALGDAVRGALIDFRGTVSNSTIDDVAHDDLDFFDRGQAGGQWRRRLGFRMRYRST